MLVTWWMPGTAAGKLGPPCTDDCARRVDGQLAAEAARRLLAHDLDQLHIAAGESVGLRHLEETRRARVDRLVDRVTQPRNCSLRLLLPGDDPFGKGLQVGVVACILERLLKHSSDLFRGPAEAVPHPQKARRDRALQRFGRAKVCHPRGDRARRHAVLDQRDRDRVEHHRLLRSREPALELQEREVAERHVADELGQVVAAHDNLVRRAPAHFRVQLLPRHVFLVRRVLYDASPKPDSVISSTRQRNVSVARTAFSISSANLASAGAPSATSTSIGTGGSTLTLVPSRTIRARPVTCGRNRPTTARIADGYTFTPRTMNMSSRRPTMRMRKVARPQPQSPL